MKHILLVLIIAALAVASCACSTPEAAGESGAVDSDTPPALTLYVNEEEPIVNLAPGTYEWIVDNGDGTMTGVNADAPHPLDVIDDLTTVDTSNCTAVEIILEEGMEVDAVSWWDAAETDYDDSHAVSGEVVTADKTVYRLPIEAGRVYDIHVDFGEKGDAFYAFAAK